MKKLSITGAASLYVSSLLLGGLALFGYFFFPHSGLAIVGGALAAMLAIAVALYSIWLVVKVLQAQR